jgi:hypothetical protein
MEKVKRFVDTRSGHLVVEKVPGCAPAVICNERERIVRLVPGSEVGNWLRLEVLEPAFKGDSVTSAIVLSDEEWLRVAEWINITFIKPKGWTP